MFIGKIILVVYTYFLEKAIMSLAVTVIAKLPWEVTETAS